MCGVAWAGVSGGQTPGGAGGGRGAWQPSPHPPSTWLYPGHAHGPRSEGPLHPPGAPPTVQCLGSEPLPPSTPLKAQSPTSPPPRADLPGSRPPSRCPLACPGHDLLRGAPRPEAGKQVLFCLLTSGRVFTERITNEVTGVADPNGRVLTERELGRRRAGERPPPARTGPQEAPAPTPDRQAHRCSEHRPRGVVRPGWPLGRGPPRSRPCWAARFWHRRRARHTAGAP